MCKRDEQLASYLGANCPQVTMIGATGKKRKVLAAAVEQLLHIIQSISSPKAGPFKLWLAQVGRERIEETIDLERAIDRALETYQKKGYDTDWIHQDPKTDSFYSEGNLAHLKKIIDRINNGTAKLEEHDLIEVD